MISEKDFEDIICKYPELIEDGLIFKGKQVHVYGKIMDILLEDRFGQKLIVELKVGPIGRKHIGQVMEYEGAILSIEEPTARIMLIGNRVPPNFQRALDHHGIEWKELSFSHLKEFLETKNDKAFLNLTQDESILIKKETIERGEITQERKTIADITLDVFPDFIRNLYENVIKPIGSSITVSRGGPTARYSSIFLEGKNIMHIYDRQPNRIQVHIAKRYLENSNIKFNTAIFSQKFIVRETKHDYPVIIKKDSDLEFLRDVLISLYSERKTNPAYNIQDILKKADDIEIIHKINELRIRIKQLDSNIKEYCRKGWIQFKLFTIFSGIDVYKKHFIVSVKLNRDQMPKTDLKVKFIKGESHTKIKVGSETNLDSILGLITEAYKNDLIEGN